MNRRYRLERIAPARGSTAFEIRGSAPCDAGCAGKHPDVGLCPFMPYIAAVDQPVARDSAAILLPQRSRPDRRLRRSDPLTCYFLVRCSRLALSCADGGWPEACPQVKRPGPTWFCPGFQVMPEV